MSDSKKKIYLGENLVCQTFTDAEEQAKAFDLFGLEQPIVSSNAPASTRPVQQGQVCEFDGVNDRIENLTDPLGDDCTISTWVKVDAIGVLQYVYDLRVGNSDTAGYLYVDTSGNLVSENGNEGAVSAGVWTKTSVIHANSSASARVKIGVRHNNAAPFGGKMSSFTATKTSTGEIVRQYNLNHASGTTAYDSSGNGNDGTLQNGAAFVVDNTLPPEADRLNLDGYTDDNGVLKPRDESEPTNDIDGNPLQYSGSVYPRRPEYRNSYAASFDGVNDYVDLGTPSDLDFDSTDSFSVYTTTSTTSSSTSAIIAKQESATNFNGYMIVLETSGKFSVSLRKNLSNHIRVETTSATIDDGDFHEIGFSYDGSQSASGITLYVDSVAVAMTTVSDTLTGDWLTSTETRIGSRDSNVIPYAGKVSSAAFYASEVAPTTLISPVAHYPLTEGAGDTAHDISGNGNHGTINNASTGTEGAGFWAGRIDGEANALNNNNGFSKRMLFDGVDDVVGLNVSPDELMETGVFDLSLDIVWDSSSIASVGRLIWFAESTGFFRIQRDATTSNFQLWARKSSGLDIIAKTAIVISADIKHTLRVVGDGVNCLVYLDGGLLNTIAMTTANLYAPTWSEVYLGYPASSGVKGVFYNWSLATASITQQLDGNGNTNADWTDQSGNGNNGTVNGSPALLRIPADTSDPTKDVFGDTLTNPAITDSYNGAETELDAYNIAEGENPSPATNNNPDLDAIEFGTDFAANDAAFMRLKSSTENDRLITFEDDLTGGDETLAQKYTQ